MKKSISQKFKDAATSSFSDKVKSEIQDRFTRADQLVAQEQRDDVGPNAHIPAQAILPNLGTSSKVEAFVFSVNEQQIIDQTMNRFLDERIIISKSETVRMAINLLKGIDFPRLKLEYEQLPKLKRGKRPAKSNR